MRIAIVVDSLARGGAERQALNATWQLSKRGCEVELIYYHEADDPHDHPAVVGGKVAFLPKGGSRCRFLWRLRNHLRRGRFDVVHAFKSTESIYAAFAGKLAGVPVILGGHRGMYRDRGLVRLAHRLVRTVVDGWIVNAHAIADSLANAIGARPEKLFVVHNGIEPLEFISTLGAAEAKQKLDLEATRPVVTMVARLHEGKNHAIFLKMAARILQQWPETCFLLVGDGPMRSSIESQISELALTDSVLLLGERASIADVLAATDVSVLTSQSEGLPNVLLESMCVGIPVVTTDYTGVEEVVTDEQEGYVVPRGDSGTLAAKVCRLLEDETLRQQMGHRGAKTVETHFRTEAMAEGLLSIYESCLVKKRRRLH